MNPILRPLERVERALGTRHAFVLGEGGREGGGEDGGAVSWRRVRLKGEGGRGREGGRGGEGEKAEARKSKWARTCK